MNEKGNDFAHGQVCALKSVPAPALALGLHAHTQWYCLLLPGQGGRGVHVLRFTSLFPSE